MTLSHDDSTINISLVLLLLLLLLLLGAYVARLLEDTPAQQALRCHIDLSLGRLPDPSWRRCPGRPRKRWLDQLCRDNSTPPAASGDEPSHVDTQGWRYDPRCLRVISYLSHQAAVSSYRYILIHFSWMWTLHAKLSLNTASYCEKLHCTLKQQESRAIAKMTARCSPCSENFR